MPHMDIRTAHAAGGDYGEALAAGQEALELARQAGDSATIRGLEERVELYRSKRQPGPAGD